ncbi:MFS general substrate transporter [Thozetella sp. PMI_491]|nr:MFS general substrate transporter [Thozetella sp. PMI_491]
MARNWSSRKKWTNVVLLAAMTLLTPFASSMFAPSVSLVSTEFHNSNETIGTLVVSIYLLGYAIGPLFLAPLSELYGRLRLYYTTSLLFILFNIACAKSNNFPMLIVFRVLTGMAGACPLTIGPGSIADMFEQEQRGRVMSIWTLPILLGPSIGPIAVTGIVSVLGLLLLNETHGPTILEHKTQRLSKANKDPSLQSALKPKLASKDLILLSIIRPSKMLLTDPIIFGLSVATAIVYGTIYLLFTTISDVFEDQYSFSSSSVGLTYLGLGIGQIIGVTAFGMVSDMMLRRMAKSADGVLKPEYRLPPLIVGTCFIAIGLIWYGWTAYKKVTWIVPILGMGFIGVGVITSFLPVSTYLVDAYTEFAASATAANTVLRSLGGALLPLCGKSMYTTLGLGWGNTLLAFVVFVNMPLALFFMWKGEAIRSSHPFLQA